VYITNKIQKIKASIHSFITSMVLCTLEVKQNLTTLILAPLTEIPKQKYTLHTQYFIRELFYLVSGIWYMKKIKKAQTIDNCEM